jgi:hypothetical protein
LRDSRSRTGLRRSGAEPSLGFTLDQLKQFLALAAPWWVCVIGETIVDEWVDVTLTNLSTQSRCVAGLETARVKHIGGAGIIARHLANFVSEVHCFTNGPAAEAPPNLHQTALAAGELVETRLVDSETGRPVPTTSCTTSTGACSPMSSPIAGNTGIRCTTRTWR